MKTRFTYLSMFALLIGFGASAQSQDQATRTFSWDDLREVRESKVAVTAAKSVKEFRAKGGVVPQREIQFRTISNKRSSSEGNFTSMSLPLHTVDASRGGGSCVLDEGFEATVPPVGWTVNQFNATQTWYSETFEPYAGLAYASVQYDDNLLDQLEQLITPSVNLSALSSPTLSFAWNGSYDWSVSPNNNCELNVYYRVNGGAWNFLWNEDTEGVFTNWQWYTESFDLSAVASQTNVQFMFEYDGNDGAQFNLDQVQVCGFVGGGPCTEAADTWGDLNTNGGAPCFNGVTCATTDPNFTTFGVYGSEAYLLDNVQAGADYIFDMCTGVGAGSWIPEITIVAPDGFTIDATNAASSGSGFTHGQQCSLGWTASQAGTYTIFIHEMGTSAGDAPNQLNCTTSYAVDNGNPTVTCGANPALCLPCAVSGTLTSSLFQTVCQNDTAWLTLDASASSPTTFEVGFDDGLGGTGGLAGGFTIVGLSETDFPWGVDTGIQGIMAANALPPITGNWVLTVYAVDGNGDPCDSTAGTLVQFLPANDPSCFEPCDSVASYYVDLNNAGGAPCFDGTTCLTTDPQFTTFGVYGSEAYLLDNVQAGFDYVFDMCSGFGAGAWIPEIRIIAPDGTTIDASNEQPATGSGATHGTQCSLAWTASQTGTYTIMINEMGTNAGDAPNQLSCFSTYAVDNGNPTVTCGANAFQCLPCVAAGTLTSAQLQEVCQNDTAWLALGAGASTPGTFEVGFSAASGGLGGPGGDFTIIELDLVDFPWGVDTSVQGIMAANALPSITGTWVLTVYAADPTGAYCDSTATTTVTFLDPTHPNCLIISTGDIEAADINVYPNPTNGEFTIELNGVNGTGQLDVMDMRGRTVYHEGVNFGGAYRETFDLDLAPASYMLRITTDHEVISRKLTIE